MIDLGLTGKRAVISGAGYIPTRAGHGRRSALTLASAGAAVACIDIDAERCNRIVQEVTALGATAIPVVADMTNPQQVARALDEAVDGLGGLDVCVDIIGKATWDSADRMSVADWHWTIENNLTHVFLLFQEAGRRLIAQGSGGSMVALASVDAIAAAGFHSAYGAAKAGVISLVKTFADEFGRYGIRVNAVAPGNVGSGNDDQPEGEYAVNGINPLAAPRAQDVANAILFLSSGLAERITGQTLVVDGGATIKTIWAMTENDIPDYRARF
jgi:NAD(P)-dependent dehydrogenase (short-subunit alcohol dehydrogenase family)